VTRITKHLDELKLRIRAAADAVGRDVNEITILAVSKRQNVDAIHEASQAGLRAMGENYVQEALEKIQRLGPEIEWHFIGRPQSNKTRAIAENFDWIHTISDEKIAKRLSRQRPEGFQALNACVQVCTDPDACHPGCAPERVRELCERIVELPGLQLRGLMVFPHALSGLDAQRKPFRELRELYDKLVADGLELDTLSMGMSGDFEAAIMEGSTMLRIGTAIFGPRDE
jgi:pyridoxal phosphate enzyme (YggS family)